MKQVVQHLRDGATRVVDVPVPRPTPGTVLVRTAVSVLSAGTERMVVDFAGRSLVGKARARPDLVRQTLDKVRKEGLLPAIDAVRSRLDEPMALGYASAGTIVEVGDGVDAFRPGDRVACAGGGHAVHGEFAVVPVNLLARLPENVSFESGTFATLGAIALHALRLGRLQLGERVAVIGLGLLGLLTAGLARAAGAVVLGIDLDEGRVRLARALGAMAHTRAEAEAAAEAASGGLGFDLVVICADGPSNDPVTLAAALARDRARVVAVGAVGLDLPRKAYYEKELEFIVSRSYGPGRYDPSYEEDGRDYPLGYVRWTEGRNLQAVVDLMGQGRLDVGPLISHRFPIERAEDAYARLRRGGPEVLGVLLTYPADVTLPTATDRFIALPSKPLSNQAVRLGVLGAGNFATVVALPALRRLSGVEFVGVAAASGLSASHAGSRFGFRYATTDEAKILSDPEVNTLAIFTRHHLHARQTIAGLRAGKHVFCEKPLALTTDELGDVAGALEGASSLLTVGFNRRFAPLAIRLQEFVKGVGAPLAMVYRVNAGPLPADHWLRDPEQGGGRLVGEVGHFIDLMTFLAGSPPVRVEARGMEAASPALEDSLLVTVRFADGSLGSIAYLATGDRSFEKERLEVFGGGRVAVLEDFRRLETWEGGRSRKWTSPMRQDKGHGAMWAAFVEAIRRGGPPPIPYADLIAVSQATIDAGLALRSGETVEVAAPRARE
ncbi:MAG TPA: bi-domain-containing oxidoreductase [Anaerolineales bacterium]|nr:bi-domain-containing oxidoreductase [Anaerolineales bacterium]